MKIKIEYKGTTSSGRMNKYAIVVAAITDAAGAITSTEAQELAKVVDGLKADGVVLNTNIGDRHFLAATHLHTAPVEGNQAEVDVKGYYDKATDRQVNYFADIDKKAQKAFAQRMLVNQQVGEIVMVETALTNQGSSIDPEKYEKIMLLRKQQALVDRQIKAIIIED